MKTYYIRRTSNTNAILISAENDITTPAGFIKVTIQLEDDFDHEDAIRLLFLKNGTIKIVCTNCIKNCIIEKQETNKLKEQGWDRDTGYDIVRYYPTHQAWQEEKDNNEYFLGSDISRTNIYPPNYPGWDTL
jgi:hypothetical protein